ncbi:MAG: transcriptional repressor [Deltaproteobacteria bacterium]|nr:transcriptional repressor [Deltaproteobacteria bacterium]
MEHADKFEAYNGYLEKKGLKSTRQRDLIVQHFFKKHQHLTVEELWGQVRKMDSKIGYATVYRTLKLLSESGLALKREFGGGQARYEHVTEHHHDHLICMGCDEIIEFENDEIEHLQDKVCKKHRFKLVNHKMELYGYCEDCSKKEKS